MTPTIEESTEQLATLVAKVNAFVNGGVETTINTNKGYLKSLSGTVADMEAIRYVAQCRDYNTLGDLVAGASADLSLGQIARVTLDPTASNNGFYQMRESGLVNVHYSDLFNLDDLPFSDLNIPFDETMTAVQFPLVQARIAVSENFIEGSVFAARLEYTSDVTGDTFYFSQSYDVRLAARGATEFESSVNTSGTSALLMADRVPVQLPTLRVDHGLEGSVHVFTVVLVTPTNADSAKVPGWGSVLIKDLDLKVFRKLP